MLGLTDSELDHRFADVLTNITVMNNEGKIGPAGSEWMERFSHLQLEFHSRGLRLPPREVIENRAAIPDGSSVMLGRKVRSVYPDGIPTSFTLFKYGKHKYLRPLMEKGELRLMPASSYDDSSLNLAVSDRELEFEKINYHERIRYKSRFDFYCFCSSWLHSDRLIADFDADCVLAITNPHEFFLRLATALDEQNFQIDFNKVTYVDPLLLGEHHVSRLGYVKHMRFAYQFEHRFVAMQQKDEPIAQRDLNLGSIVDICDIYMT